MSVYEFTNECTGCRACEQACPIKCISIKEDAEGFEYPVIDETKCIQCNVCKYVCKGIENQKNDSIVKAYAAVSNDQMNRANSSSGGVFFELGKKVLEQGGWVFGAIFDEGWRVVHVGTNKLDMLEKMRISKYVQSNTANTYSEVQGLLKRGVKVLYTGTPCQLFGLRNFLRVEYDNLVCCSIICHGVPSPLVWKRCLEAVEKKSGGEIREVRFRDKRNGWRESAIVVVVERPNGQEMIEYTLDRYKEGFLENLYLRPSCYQCQAKENEFIADITLGDFWGIEKFHRDIDDDKGSSAVLVFSQQGEELLQSIGQRLTLRESTYKNIEQGNFSLNLSVNANANRERFFYEMNSSENIERVISDNLKNMTPVQEQYYYQYPTVLRYLKNKVKGYKTEDFFEKSGYKKIAVYAGYDLSLLFCDDLRNSKKVKIVCICDKNTVAFEGGYKGIKIVGIDELIGLYEKREIDCVVIGYLPYENVITRELLAKGIANKDILSLNHVVYGIGD